ncbi:putative mitochondrial hypothetical protein [Leptomonas pyrrhocoris]|uniref:EngB-type G domain-containing protein n=1 Tax=Leptomonas pyrrhocoris TaxID=157538 RepID=A0A0N0VHN1_LEPPY|nr:putative mitochondrial hypothetical protein [Leptomonas pyrrhocoris]KPA85678.1 putative mitochondrial hypothetical protein [Leptomonas pyrrhocoris]|eukprot:XP_015664117.1 putative mitochondrial hypothetical protein [Leptomonas pyrrhocoris]
MPPFSLNGRCYCRVAHLDGTSLQEWWTLKGCIYSTAASSARGYSTRGNRCPPRSLPRGGSLLHRSTAAQPSAFGKAAQLAQRLQQSPWGDATGAQEAAPSSSLRNESPESDGAAAWSVSRSAAARTSQHYPEEPSSSPPPLSLQRRPQLQPQRLPFASSSPSVLTAERVRTGDAASHVVAETLTWSVGNDMAEVQDDDIVLDTPASLLPCLAAATHELKSAHQRRPRSSLFAPHQKDERSFDLDAVTPESNEFAHPAARGVGQDVIDLVTDAFTAQREAAVQRRRQVLYDLTHPNPIDYTYNGKLVPPPPLSFGRVTAEARSLGNTMMLGQTYSLVRQAGTRAAEDDFCGTIYTGAGKSTAGKTTISPSSTIETTVGGASSSSSAVFSPPQRHAPYRSRAREDNIFRDHNYFFEVNELYQEIVLVGRACAGKSSLLNSLLGQNVAKTSSSPNTTRKISFYQSVTPDQLHAFHAKEHHNQLVKLPGGGLQLTFVDMPGYGIEGMSDQWRDAAIELTDAYFGVRRSVNTVLYCMDCERGLTKTDVKYFEWLENVQGTFFVVLTKCDSVPHSRVTSVMRQVYTLITKNRRKYRKVFPFIIPTSAKDGTNVELLRGLITETSGMIPGDKLRDLLRQKKEAFTQVALLEESNRIEAARQLERAQAKEFFQLTHGHAVLESEQAGSISTGSSPPLDAAERERGVSESGGSASADGAARFPSADAQHDSGPQRYVVGLGHSSADVAESLFLTGEDASSTPSVFSTAAMAEEAAAQTRRERRERFLAWRRAHPLATTQPSYGASAAWEGEGEAVVRDTDARGGQDAALFSSGTPACAEEGHLAASVLYPEGAEKEGMRHSACENSRQNTEAAPTLVARTKGGRYRLHTGLDNPQSAQTVLDVPGDAGRRMMMMTGMDDNSAEVSRQQTIGRDGRLTTENTTAPAESLSSSPPPPPSPVTRSSVIGFTPGPAGAAPSSPSSSFVSSNHNNTRGNSHNGAGGGSGGGGAVSHFLDVLEDFSQQPNTVKSAKQRRKEARWQRKQKGTKVGGALLVEDASGRLSSYQAGRPCGPALASLDDSLESRQAKWRAQQLKELIAKENPEAPWQAMQPLRRKLQASQEEAALSGMRKKEVAAYLRDAGRVTDSFAKFEGEVTAAKYMNEFRQAPTLRSQQQMHLNATAKINYRSMPPGLWKQYGGKETYWPTPQVLGRAQDESHRP